MEDGQNCRSYLILNLFCNYLTEKGFHEFRNIDFSEILLCDLNLWKFVLYVLGKLFLADLVARIHAPNYPKVLVYLYWLEITFFTKKNVLLIKYTDDLLKNILIWQIYLIDKYPIPTLNSLYERSIHELKSHIRFDFTLVYNKKLNFRFHFHPIWLKSLHFCQYILSWLEQAFEEKKEFLLYKQSLQIRKKFLVLIDIKWLTKQLEELS